MDDAPLIVVEYASPYIEKPTGCRVFVNRWYIEEGRRCKRGGVITVKGIQASTSPLMKETFQSSCQLKCNFQALEIKEKGTFFRRDGIDRTRHKCPHIQMGFCLPIGIFMFLYEWTNLT